MSQVEYLEERSLLNAAIPGVTLDPQLVPKFVNPLPNPLDPSFIYQPTQPGGSDYQVGVYQISQDLGLGLTDASGNPIQTTVWGYGTSATTATYPGRTFVAQQNQPITVHWTNNLVDGTGNPLPHLLPVDTTLLDPKMTALGGLSTIGVPIVPHLHGGHTEAVSDGTPQEWFTPLNDVSGNPLYTGDDYVKSIFTYDNTQQATTLWYHDHAMGVTRLNVYAGLAGFYIIHDSNEDALVAHHSLPAAPYDVPLVIQDRMFTAGGQLYYPADVLEDTTATYPSVHPEFFGDTILVNGKAWPVLDVEPRMYRFRVLDGSNSRFYSLRFDVEKSSFQPFFQIGTDGGLLNQPVSLDRVLIGPGERADLVVDFSKLAGKTIILSNDAKGPFPKGEPADPKTVGQIMAFRVSQPKDPSIPDAVLPATLNTITALGPAATTRELALYEREDQYDRLEQNLGTLAGPQHFMDPITEVIKQGDTEIWKIYNTTADTHPIHLHQVQFQIVSRQKFNWKTDPVTGGIIVTGLTGQPRGPDANEAGWKDTARMNPGEVTIVEAKFDLPGKYVWHCHILEHEEHDMMRYFLVVPPTSATQAATPMATLSAATNRANGALLIDPPTAATRSDLGWYSDSEPRDNLRSLTAGNDGAQAGAKLPTAAARNWDAVLAMSMQMGSGEGAAVHDLLFSRERFSDPGAKLADVAVSAIFD